MITRKNLVQGNKRATETGRKGSSRRRRLFAYDRLEDRCLLATNITQFHVDTQSTGANLTETQLTPSNVNAAGFGQLYNTPVDGPVNAEPLVLTNVNITAGGSTGSYGSVVFVATQNDSLYAINAATGAVLWKRSFLDTANPNDFLPGATSVTAVPNADVNNGASGAPTGITSTPVIDPSTNIIYVLPATKETVGGNAYYVQRLHAINVADGSDAVSSFMIGSTTNGNTNTTPIAVNGTGDGNVNGVVQFNALREFNRPALSLVNGQVYAEWASHSDYGPYHGWVVSWNVANLATQGMVLSGVLCATPNGGDGGIWQGAGGPTFDPSETFNGQPAFYLETGNGTIRGGDPPVDADGFPADGNYYESLIKVEADPSSNAGNPNSNGWGLKIADYFTPYNVNALDKTDEDFGSGAPLVLPDSAGLPGHPHLLVAAGKEGKVYLIDRDDLGKFNVKDDNVLNSVYNPQTGVTTPPVLLNGSLSTPAYYHGTLYWVAGYSSHAWSFVVAPVPNPNNLPNIPAAAIQPTSEAANSNFGYIPGSVMVTANGGNDPNGGIVWIMDRNNKELHAYSSLSLSTELWNSGLNSINVMKFAPPTIANGQVFVGTTAGLQVFGITSSGNPVKVPDQPANVSAQALSGTSVELTWTDTTVSPNFATNYAVQISQGGGPFTTLANAGQQSTSFTVTGLNPNTAYSFQLVSGNSAGSSAASSIATVTTTNQTGPNPTAPLGLGATPASGTEAYLNWTNTAANQTGFTLTRATDNLFTQNVVIQTLGSAPYYFTDAAPGMSPGNTYYYRLQATNSAGLSSFSNTASVDIPLVPAAPTNASAVFSSGQIVVSWTDQAGPFALGYQISRSVDGGPYALLADLPETSDEPPSTQTYTDPNVALGHTYSYSVVARNVSGFSGAASASFSTNENAVLSLDSSGNLVFTVAPGIQDQLSIELDGGIYTLTDSSLISSVAGTAASFVNGADTSTLTIPASLVSSITLDTSDGTDFINLISAAVPITVTADSGGGIPMITLGDSDDDETIGGSLTNGTNGTLLVSGSGTTTIAGDLICQGNGGLILAGDGSVNLTGMVSLGALGNLTDSSTGTNTITGVISGNQVVKSGSGTLTLTNADNALGATVVNSGVLVIDGPLINSSSVTVNAGGTLGGGGSIPSTLVQNGGVFTPGDSAGPLTVQQLTLSDGSIFQELLGLANPGTQNGLAIIPAGGFVALNNAVLSVSFAVGFVPDLGRQFTLIRNQSGNPAGGTFSQENTLTSSGYTFGINYAGGAGNDVVLTVIGTPTFRPTTTTLTSSPSVLSGPGVFGQTITFTATVSPDVPVTDALSGSMVFQDGSVILGTLPVSQGSASLSISSLSVGAHNITATFIGTNGWLGSAGSVSQPVNQAATATTLAVSQTESVFNQSVTFTATVTPNAPAVGTPTGYVTFMDGNTTLGTAALNGAGGNDQAVFSTASLSPGVHNITAVYGADSNFLAGSSSALSQSIDATPQFQGGVLALPGTGSNATITLTPVLPSGASAYRIDVTYTSGAITTDFGTFAASSIAIYGGPGTGAVILNGTAGVDTFTVGNGIVTENASLTTAFTVSLNGVSSTTISGVGGVDTLTGPNQTNTWLISSPNAGLLDGVIGFRNIANLVGGSGNNTFVFSRGASISGWLNGGGGTNVLDESSVDTAIALDVNASTVSGVGNSFSNIQTVLGGTNPGNTLTGPSTFSVYGITGANAGTINTNAYAGTINTLNFANFGILTGGPGVDTFTFSNNGSLSGSISVIAGGIGTVYATKSAGFTLTNNSLSSTDGMAVGLNGITTANLTDTGSGHAFTVTGWTGGGTFKGSAETLVDRVSKSAVLTNASLAVTGLPVLNLSGFAAANLTDTAGGKTFTVSGWTGTGSWINSGAVSDTIAATKSAGFTLTNNALSSTDGMTLGLSGITIANLSANIAGKTFTVDGWTGTGSLSDTGGGVIAASKNGSFSLSNTSFSAGDGILLSLSGVSVANLTDTGSGHVFSLNNWTGGGTLKGSAATLFDTVSRSVILANASLGSPGLPTMTLTGFNTANLTDTTGGNTLTVSGWTGNGSWTDTAAVPDTVAATKSAGFTLTNNALSSTDGMAISLTGITIANLSANIAGKTFTVDGWTGTGSLSDTGGGVIAASKNGGFTLSNTSFSSSDGILLGLSGVSVANLTDTGGGHPFSLNNWTGGGTLKGSAATLFDTVSRSVVLANATLGSPGLPTMTLTGFNTANLNDITGGNTLTVSGWTGAGSWANTGAVPDTVAATKSAGFTLTNNALSSTDGMTLGLSGITIANLSANIAGKTFTVDGWIGTGSLSDTGGGVIAASKNSGFSLSNTSFSAGDGILLSLSGVSVANLTDTGSGHVFSLNNWTGGGTLKGSAATLFDTVSRSIVLANASLGSPGLPTMTLIGFNTANLNDITGGNTLTVSGWTGNGSWTNTGTIADTIAAAKSASFTLANNALSSNDGMTLGLSGITIANLSAAVAGKTFTVDGWTGTGSLSDTGGGVIAASKNGGFLLSNTSFSAGDGILLSLSGVSVANLTDTGGSHPFALNNWTGGGTLKGSAATLFDTVSRSVILANASLGSPGLPTMTLIGFNTANLNDITGGNTLTVSGWTGNGSWTNTGAVPDTVAATKNANFSLTNNALSSTDGMTLGLSGITIANLSATSAGKTFTVDGWTGTGSLSDTGGGVIAASKNGGFSLSNTSFSSSDGILLGLSGVSVANLTDTGGGHPFSLNNWTGGGTLKGSAATLFDTVSRSVVLANASLGSPGLPTMTLIGFNTANLNDITGGNTLTVSGWTGNGSWTNTGAVPDTVAAAKSAGFTLSNTSVSSGDGMILGLSGITIANLSAAIAGKTFTVDGWTGTGSLSDTGGGVVSASKNGGFTLSNTSVSSGDGMILGLSGISIANLTDTGGGHSFAVAGWSGGGTLNGSTETLVDNVSSSVVLSNASLAVTGLPVLNLSGFNTANFIDTTGGNTFTVSGWTGTGSWIDAGAVSDTIAAAKSAGFTLANNALSSTDGMTLGLTGITIANLSDVGGGSTFSINGWTGGGSLAGIADTLIDSVSGRTTLSNTALAVAGLPTLTLTGFSAANLNGGPTADTFDLSGWTGAGVLVGGTAGDTLTAAKDANMTLTNARLSAGDGLGVTLVGIPYASLTASTTVAARVVDASGFSGTSFLYGTGAAGLTLKGGTGTNLFVLDGYNGAGALTVAWGGLGTVYATKSAGFTLSNNSLSSTDGMAVSLNGIGTANLTATSPGKTFTVDGWTGTGSLSDTGGGVVSASKNGGFSLSNTSLSSSDGMVFGLSGITVANLTDTGGGHSFAVAGWTGGGTLNGSTETLVDNVSSSVVLSNASLAVTGLPVLNLSGFNTANLTDINGGNTFTVGGWTGNGSWTNTGAVPDTIAAAKSAGFTLSNTSVSAGDGMTLGLSGVTIANLSANIVGKTFTVDGWTGTGSLSDTAGGVVAASKNGGFTLSNMSVSSSDGILLGLSGITVANLTDTGNGHIFTVNGWTGGGTFKGSAATLIDSVSKSVVLSNASLAVTGLPTLNLSGFNTANLTDITGGNTFTVSGWTGNGSWTNTGAVSDTITAAKSAGFTLSNTSVSAGDGMILGLSGVTIANLTATSASKTFTVDGWTGTGSLSDTGGGVVAASKNGGFTLSNTSVSAGDGILLGLSGISVANLTDTGSGHSFAVNGWTGGGTLKGSAETLIAGVARSIVLSNASLGSPGLSTVGLSGFNTANFIDTTGGNTFTAGGWTGNGSWTNAGAAVDTIAVAKSAGFTLTNNSLSSTDGMAMSFSGITIANLNATSAGKTFTVDGWTGTGSLSDTGGGIVSASKNGGFTLSNTSVSAGDGILLGLSGISVANLTDTGSGHSFAVTGWTGGGTLKGSAETLIASVARSIVLSNASLGSPGLSTVGLSGFNTANFIDTTGGNTFTVGGWTGNGSWTNAGAVPDTIAAAKSAGFTLTNNSLSSTDGMAVGFSGITIANLNATSAGKTFTVDGWTGTGSLSDTGAGVVSASKNSGFTLSNTSFSAGDGMMLGLSGISIANVTATATSGTPSYIIDAAAFTGVTNLAAAGTVNAILFGGSGNGGTLSVTGSGNNVLIGGSGNETLSDNGTGYNILIGGPGGETIRGNGKDILISGTASYGSNTRANIAALDAILAEWASSDSYSLRISKIMSGVGSGGTAALNSTTVQSDATANTLTGSSSPAQNNWFISNAKDKVTKQAQETNTTF